MTEPVIGADGPVAGREDAVTAATGLLERMAQQLGGRASVSTVFGTPVAADGVTVIPVARAGFGFGGGAGREKDSSKHGEGGGGGGGASVTPIGFIEIRDGTAVYRPIRDVWADVVLPLGLLLLGTAGPHMATKFVRRRRAGRGGRR